MRVEDFRPDLMESISGMDDPATAHLRGVLASSWTSSSEMLGEIGQSIRGIERTVPDIQDSVRKAFNRAMNEIHKVWPTL